MKLDRENIDALQGFFAAIEERETRAAERLALEASDHLHFAIIGLRSNVESYAFDHFATLRRVVDPPNEVELALALKSKDLFAPIGRYAELVRYELSVDKTVWPDPKSAIGLAEAIISMMRVKTGAELLVPAVADHSWSTIAALKGGECAASLVEDYPRVAQLEPPRQVTSEDLDWVKAYVVSFVNLRSSAAFSLAVESAATHHLSGNDRMMVAALWAGVEALFGVSAELSFRIAAYTASMLEPRGQQRLDRYRKTKKLYDTRSKVVHGSAISTEAIRQHILDARALLGSLLVVIVESGEVPTAEKLDAALFS